MTVQVTMTFNSEDEARAFGEHVRHVYSHTTVGKKLIPLFEAKYPPSASRVRCPHSSCRRRGEWANAGELRNHLVKVHHYSAEDYVEDSAMSNAWRVFREAGLKPGRY